ncbi:MAG TPA: hypothetical protein VJU61_21415 [Polyangiaceae bacterium]|nr:hypothetical protein [Polyangiaceae bacterium]
MVHHKPHVPRSFWAALSGALFACQANTSTPAAQAPEVAAQPPSSEQPAAAPLASAPGKAQPGVTSDCGNYSVIAQGSLQVMNNVWAREKAQGAFEQCVLRRGTGGQAQLGWTWAWPGFEPGGYSFPEIIFGWKPWSAGSTDARLPIQISGLKELSLRYVVNTESTGKLSLTAAVWLTTSGQAAAANPLAITDEIAILLDYPEGFTPPGTRGASLLVDGVEYGLWHTPNNGDLGNGTGWNLYYLQGPSQRLQGTLKLDRFLEALRGKQLVSAERYVASVEFGNELMSGSGTTWVNDFEVVVTPR